MTYRHTFFSGYCCLDKSFSCRLHQSSPHWVWCLIGLHLQHWDMARWLWIYSIPHRDRRVKSYYMTIWGDLGTLSIAFLSFSIFLILSLGFLKVERISWNLFFESENQRRSSRPCLWDIRHPKAVHLSVRHCTDYWGGVRNWMVQALPNRLHFSHRICVKTTGTPAGMGPSLRLEPGFADEIQLPGAVGRFLPAAGRVVAQGGGHWMIGTLKGAGVEWGLFGLIGLRLLVLSCIIWYLVYSGININNTWY